MPDYPGRYHLSTQNRVRRKVKDILAGLSVVEEAEEELVETGGIAFSNGHCIEPIKDDVSSLILLDSKSKKCHERINLGGGYMGAPPCFWPTMRTRQDEGSESSSLPITPEKIS